VAGLCLIALAAVPAGAQGTSPLTTTADSFFLGCQSRDGYGSLVCKVACSENGIEIWRFDEVESVHVSKTVGSDRWWLHVHLDTLKADSDQLITFGPDVACVLTGLQIGSTGSGSMEGYLPPANPFYSREDD
jgi:hypothetical protein